jgi:hypothetical protein
MRRMDESEARKLVEDGLEARNKRDFDRVLRHFAETPGRNGR